MRKILLVCAALACMTVSPVPAQDAAVKKIIEMGQNDNQVMHQLDILTNRFGGRLIGSDAYENAAEWMVREFKSWGLDVQLEEAGRTLVERQRNDPAFRHPFLHFRNERRATWACGDGAS